MLQYMIVKKCEIKGTLPRYDCESVENNMLEAQKKIEAHKLLNTEKYYSFFIIPFNEKTIEDLKIAS
jgi:hypothetical protein